MLKKILTIILIAFTAMTIQSNVSNHFVQHGKASYYGNKFHGRKTASGEKYDKNKMTCAHKTLPFGTKLKVTNVKNQKTVIVTVNDRGPYAKGRIIDLSYAAAQQLDMIHSGVATVHLEKI